MFYIFLEYWDPHHCYLCSLLDPILVRLMFIFFQDVVPKYPITCDVQWVGAEDPLFLLYTSGSTGKPKVLYLYCISSLHSLKNLKFFFLSF